MQSRNIPLNALRVFEVASRHLSFTLAAEELHVSQAAVSQQIRTLEKQLGLQLFFRKNRKLSLTSAGAELALETKIAITGLQEAIDRIIGINSDGALTISTISSFASRWLVPRLSQFQELHTDIQLHVQTVDRKVDLFGSGIDAAIRWASRDEAGLTSEFLMHDSACLVCSPALAFEIRKNPAQLQNQTLIVDGNALTGSDKSPLKELTPEYLAEKFQLDLTTLKVLSFTQSDNVVVSALASQGMALTRLSLCADEIEKGNLEIVLDYCESLKYGYSLVYPEYRGKDRRLEAFRTWVLAESENFKTS